MTLAMRKPVSFGSIFWTSRAIGAARRSMWLFVSVARMSTTLTRTFSGSVAAAGPMEISPIQATGSSQVGRRFIDHTVLCQHVAVSDESSGATCAPGAGTSSFQVDHDERRRAIIVHAHGRTQVVLGRFEALQPDVSRRRQDERLGERMLADQEKLVGNGVEADDLDVVCCRHAQRLVRIVMLVRQGRPDGDGHVGWLKCWPG